MKSTIATTTHHLVAAAAIATAAVVTVFVIILIVYILHVSFVIHALFLFFLSCCHFSGVSLAPLGSTILKPNLHHEQSTDKFD